MNSTPPVDVGERYPARVSFGDRYAKDSLLEIFKENQREHRDVTESYFQIERNEIVTKLALTPAMYTTDPYVIGQDCLCYFMQRMGDMENE